MLDKVADAATVVSAIATLAVAMWMYWQIRLMVKSNRIEEKRHDSMLAFNSRLNINQLWNNYNSMIVNGDSELRGFIGKYDLENIDSEMVRRVFLTFIKINNIEVAWLLKETGVVCEKYTGSLVEDIAKSISNDAEAAKIALDGRGYSREFIEEIWPLVFPDEPIPCV